MPSLYKGADSADIIIITTVGCLKTHVVDVVGTTLSPTRTFTWACRGFGACFEGDAARIRHAAARKVDLKRRMRPGLRFSEIISDEYHDYRLAGTDFLQWFKDANRNQLEYYNVRIALMPCSCTAFSSGFSNPISYYEAQHAEWWEDISDLDYWPIGATDDPVLLENAVLRLISDGTLGRKRMADVFSGDKTNRRPADDRITLFC